MNAGIVFQSNISIVQRYLLVDNTLMSYTNIWSKSKTLKLVSMVPRSPLHTHPPPLYTIYSVEGRGECEKGVAYYNPFGLVLVQRRRRQHWFNVLCLLVSIFILWALQIAIWESATQTWLNNNILIKSSTNILCLVTLFLKYWTLLLTLEAT